MLYMHEFFETKELAKEFKKGFGRGVIYNYHGASKSEYIAEYLMALDCGTKIDPRQKPYCVAWNEPNDLSLSE